MVNHQRTEELIPSARRLITSLRDMGYDFSAAVADIVDNSIEAQATNAWITVHFEGAGSWVRIADDGFGMSAETLTSAMRYGAERAYGEEDLGRFGLGLKTASMSQCRRLSVASRSTKDRARLVARRWDLDHIEKTDAWELIHLSKEQCPVPLVEPLRSWSGTVVLWERLDRILGYKQPGSEAARKRLAQMSRDVEHHLAMVFHRFLGGEVKGRELNLYINGNKIDPWDPYARGETGTRTLKKTIIPIEQEGLAGKIALQPYVLPRQSKFSSNKAFEGAAGPDKWNRQQGFYIYRADRMIQSGGWSGLRTIDEHTKLARVALSFSPKLDAAFKINVAKMRVQLPSDIRGALNEVVKPVIKAAQAEYREGGEKLPHISGSRISPQPVSDGRAAGVPLDDAPSLTAVGKTEPLVEVSDRFRSTWSLEELRTQLMSLANSKEAETLSKLFERLYQRLSAR